MSLLFGSKEILCDGCAAKICNAPDRNIQVGEYPYRRPQSLRDVFPSDAIVVSVSGWFGDSGGGSPARETADSHSLIFLRHYCPTCAPVAQDKLAQEFQRLPLVDQLAEHE